MTPAAPVASKSRLYAVDDAPVVHSFCEVRLETADKYGNRLDTGDIALNRINSRAVGTGVSSVETTDNGDGTYTLRFSGAVAGDVRVVVRLDNTDVRQQDNPLVVSFVKGAGGAEEAAAEEKKAEEGAAERARDKKKPSLTKKSSE